MRKQKINSTSDKIDYFGIVNFVSVILRLNIQQHSLKLQSAGYLAHYQNKHTSE